MRAAKYHQWIYDELGDRDYDSFEFNEHHLLKEKILFAVHGPPKELEGGTIGYDDKQIKECEDLYEKIRTKNKWNKDNFDEHDENCIAIDHSDDSEIECVTDQKEEISMDIDKITHVEAIVSLTFLQTLREHATILSPIQSFHQVGIYILIYSPFAS
ncbi:putative cognition protein [Trypoxylus dichotomus]